MNCLCDRFRTGRLAAFVAAFGAVIGLCTQASADSKIDPVALGLAPIDLSPAANPATGNNDSTFDPRRLVNGHLADTILFDTTSLTVQWLQEGQTPVGQLLDVGTLVSQGSGNPLVAAFVFNSIHTNGLNIKAVGSRPLAILSLGNATFSGLLIDGAGRDGGADGHFLGRRGGGVGGVGAGGGGTGGDGNGTDGLGQSPGLGGVTSSNTGVGGYGGAHVGDGGLRENGRAEDIASAYGSVDDALTAGSGGGGGSERDSGVVVKLDGGGGGGGGGAIELGAVGSLKVSSTFITVAGGDGRDGESTVFPATFSAGSGGGGAGGMLRLHGGTVDLTGVAGIFAHGGDGGGGGGVRVESDRYVMNTLTRETVTSYGTVGSSGASIRSGQQKLVFDELVIAENDAQILRTSGGGVLNGLSIDRSRPIDLTLESGSTLGLQDGSTLQIQNIALAEKASLLVSVEPLRAMQFSGEQGGVILQQTATLSDASGGFGGDIRIDYLAADALHIAPAAGETYTLSGEISGRGGIVVSGPGMLILNGDTQYTGQTRVSGGTLEIATHTGPSRVLITDGGTLTGDGTIGGILELRRGGTLRPGVLGSGLDELTLDNALEMDAGGTVAITLGANGQNASVDAESLELDGLLHLLPVETATEGDQYRILSADVVSGRFEQVLGIQAGPDLLYAVTYTNMHVDVTVALPGDANLDGQVDALDVLIVADSFDANGTWAEGDFDGDGLVALDDLTILGGFYGTGATDVGLIGFEQALVAAGLVVPEPASMFLGAGASLVLRRRRRID